MSRFAAATGGMLTLFRIPAYSPHLNPDEWVCKNVKSDRVGRSGITGPDQFATLCVNINALRRLQRMPHRIRGFFAAPDLASPNPGTTRRANHPSKTCSPSSARTLIAARFTGTTPKPLYPNIIRNHELACAAAAARLRTLSGHWR